MTRNRIFGCLALLLVLVVGAASAPGQSPTTSAIRGHVENEGAGLPGVLVTLKSPALQGERTATTSGSGDYTFVGIPPGDYTVTFKLQGFETVTKKLSVTATQQQSLDVKMSLAGITAAATVTATAETVSTTTQASTTITTDLTNRLPVARTMLSAVAASSGVAQVTGMNNAYAISGAMTSENLFTVDGAVVQDNTRSTPNALFIEDAIQETTTSVSAISAEYGRFTGGIVNTVTKSGGNTFSGSFRATLTDDAWTAISPSHETRTQKVNPRYEATLGGPIWTDHVWFFGSGRYQKTDTAGQTSFTLLPYSTVNDEKRYQGKLTLTPVANQTISGNYLKIDSSSTGTVFGTIMDLDSLTNRQDPQEILTLNYNGVLTSNLFVEGLYSRRKYTFENNGSTYTDLIKGTLMRDRSRGNARYNSPTFCGVCSPEERNNRDYLVKGTYFLSSSSLGSHNIVLGYDNFSGTRKANNYQSGSNWRLFGTSTIFQDASGKYLGDIYPVVDKNTYIYYTPIDTLSKGTDTLTHSVFLNDSWRLNDRLSFNLGVRWDKNDAKDSRGITTAKDSAFSPRIAASYDVTAKGNLRVGASYASYVAGIQDNLVDSASNAGAPSTYFWYLNVPGAPVINSPAVSPLVTRAQALQQIFDWFFAQGCPNLSTCKVPLAYASVAGVSTVIPPDGLKSPHADEYTVGVNGSLGRLSYRADFVRREWKDLYYQKLDTSTGQVSDSLGHKFDLGIQGNTNDLKRNYTALQAQLQYRMKALFLTANWTWSHTLGNYDGEASNTGPAAASAETYPEYKNPAWNNPYGSLLTDQRHRVRASAIYDLPFVPEKLGAVSLGLIQSWDTGAPYGAIGSVRSRGFVTNPGYVTPPSSVTYYFTARDAFRTDDIKRTDLSLNFAGKVAGLVEIFVQPQVLNLFNNQGKIAVNQTVRTFASPGGGNYANFNPFTTAPQQGISAPKGATPTSNWDYARVGTCTTADPTAAGCALSFGAARSVADYQLPRTFQITMGVRF
jgi:outer membrane receptor protein involved in Fe transport